MRPAVEQLCTQMVMCAAGTIDMAPGEGGWSLLGRPSARKRCLEPSDGAAGEPERGKQSDPHTDPTPEAQRPRHAGTWRHGMAQRATETSRRAPGKERPSESVPRAPRRSAEKIADQAKARRELVSPLAQVVGHVVRERGGQHRRRRFERHRRRRVEGHRRRRVEGHRRRLTTDRRRRTLRRGRGCARPA